MTPAQRAATERLAAALDDLHSPFDIEATVTLLRELAAEPVQEPAIWIQSNHLQHAKNGPYLARTGPTKLMSDFIPLYAAPQQPMHCPKDGGECGAGGYCRPEPVQRRPLTDKEIIELPAWDDYMGGCITLLDFARAIEKAHDITGEQK